MTEEKAKDVAKDTAVMLGTAYCVVRDHPIDGEFAPYRRSYVENRLYLGEIDQWQVVAAYGPDGEEMDLKLISAFN